MKTNKTYRSRMTITCELSPKMWRRKQQLDMGQWLCRRWGGVWLRLPDIAELQLCPCHKGETGKAHLSLKVITAWIKAGRKDYALYPWKRRSA